MKKRYFGTDGIRGRVGEAPITPEFMLRLGWACGRVFSERAAEQVSVIIGKDTRVSGYMFESALEAGLVAAGANVKLLGPLPTPAIAMMTRSQNAAVGIVISASHNPYYDNGIKFFSGLGAKLSDELELAIEAALEVPMQTVDSAQLGKATRLDDAAGRYIEFCKSSFTNLDLNGLSILLDCANGATYSVAPKVFSELGANVETIAASPDGININQNCGSTSPNTLKEAIAKGSYDLGIAFDGDGDRVLIVNSDGEVLDGDDILYILSKTIPDGSGVVGTLMTNKALELYFQNEGIQFSRADVGDKYVLQSLVQKSWFLGGEPSGHIICLDSAPTGDAIIAALKLLNAIKANAFSIKKSLEDFKKFPQTLINLKVDNPNKIILSDKFWEKVTEIEFQLGDDGRVLIRPSGTEPLIRIMVESGDSGTSENLCNSLADLAQTI